MCTALHKPKEMQCLPMTAYTLMQTQTKPKAAGQAWKRVVRGRVRRPVCDRYLGRRSNCQSNHVPCSRFSYPNSPPNKSNGNTVYLFDEQLPNRNNLHINGIWPTYQPPAWGKGEVLLKETLAFSLIQLGSLRMQLKQLQLPTLVRVNTDPILNHKHTQLQKP